MSFLSLVRPECYHHGRDGHHGRDCHHVRDNIIMVEIIIMVEDSQDRQNCQSNFNFPGNLRRAAFAIVAMFMYIPEGDKRLIVTINFVFVSDLTSYVTCLRQFMQIGQSSINHLRYTAM